MAVNRGDELTPTVVREQPIRVSWNAEPTSYYTLILVGKSISNSNLNGMQCVNNISHFNCYLDPDAPSRKRPKHRSFQHWIVGNIPGNNVAAGDVLTECK